LPKAEQIAFCHAVCAPIGYAGRHSQGRGAMAKGQAKSNKETRKPKAEKPKKQNASNPSTK
jgi:hypothetical protein